MKPWELLGRTQTHDGSEMTLTRHTSEYVIQIDGQILMSSRTHGSEDALAVLGCAPLLIRQGIDPAEAGEITALLQRCGFRWGLDGRARGGDPQHSLRWAIEVSWYSSRSTTR